MSSEAQRRASRNHSKKQIQINLKYEPYELEEYEKIKIHCNEIDMTIQAYLKKLAREDMKKWE